MYEEVRKMAHPLDLGGSSKGCRASEHVGTWVTSYAVGEAQT